jgi:hypothetical protein
MKILDIITERKDGKLTKRQQQSTTGVNIYSDAEKASGDYTAYRLGMAVAGSNGKDPIEIDAKSWIGKKKSTHPYTKQEQDMLKQAYKAVGASWKDLNKGNMDSDELNSTNTVSAVPKRKKNQYGV